MTRRTRPRNLLLVRENGSAPEPAEPRSACDGPRLLEQPIRYERKAAPVADILTRPTDSGGQPRRTYQFDSDGWRRLALRSTVLTDAAKVLAAVLADSVKVDGTISVPRSALADRCGCSDRQISERLKQLVEVRFLDRVSAGKRGHTAVYRALRPTESARQNRPHPKPKRAVSPDAFTTAQPRAFSEPLSVSAPTMRAAHPPTSRYVEDVTSPRATGGSTSALPSLRSEERSAEVDPATASRHRQEREDREPVRLGAVLDGLFSKRSA